MTPADYDAWYRTPRGAWIGETEYRLLRDALAPRAGETLLDVGCGTGYFTRRFAKDGFAVTGLDIDPAMLDYARTHAAAGERYLQGDARRLPFPRESFDLAVSVAALCFVEEEGLAVAEILRVTRRRFAIGLLNRRSLLYHDKGRHGGSGAYRGARWHTSKEAAALLEGLPARGVRVSTAVFLADGGRLARLVERVLPRSLPLGALLVVAGVRTAP
ncbi:MAG: class I SAM-dependent methyltransferase [Burkholderiales bacterium]|nr:class I SAM-dependent methyltransferase [Burkholderiales bacterium]